MGGVLPSLNLKVNFEDSDLKVAVSWKDILSNIMPGSLEDWLSNRNYYFILITAPSLRLLPCATDTSVPNSPEFNPLK